MEPIEKERLQSLLDSFLNEDVYLHLETTNGAYASHFDESFFSASAYIRNALISYEHGVVAGNGPYRVGLKMNIGWVYGEGLTHFELDKKGRLLMAGHGPDGKLGVAFEISRTPFDD
ncbi:YojF family protein [Shouchella tritolerans]|uniref:YojF family protein n=1 Tax=Shouchella tritolerans TaxID=2979466 RepID=UPI000788725A|nr:YojF family protein [Shouchella tritolerans]